MNRPPNLQSCEFGMLLFSRDGSIYAVLMRRPRLACAAVECMNLRLVLRQAISSLFQVIHVGYSLLHGSSRSLVRTNHFTSQETPREIGRCGSSDAIPGPCSARHCFSLCHNRREWRMLLWSVAVL